MSHHNSTPCSAPNETASGLPPLSIAPARVIRGVRAIEQAGDEIARLGRRPLLVGGDRSLSLVVDRLAPIWQQQPLTWAQATYNPDCSEATLARLKQAVADHQADAIVATGGGKSLDAAKLLAYSCGLPVVTIPSSAATCAAWTALSNIYSDDGAFLYDVGLAKCPDLLVLDYSLIATAPQRTLVAGIGDALAKWYEASVSSGRSEQTLIVAAVQQARVLRDLLLQKSVAALERPGEAVWREVVDATVLLAGAIGGLGGAQCRTVAAHAVHNGLTHLSAAHGTLHGEKVAYGILVQLRLEETICGHQLASAARQQLIEFYAEIGLPSTLADLGLENITLGELHHAAQVACDPKSDIHRLPFAVVPEQLMAAMVSTNAPAENRRGGIDSMSRDLGDAAGDDSGDVCSSDSQARSDLR
ncbi:iron-containing alcohol dehydrogenase family protein [Oxynema sp. CENA135]|uniref:iron-containing alcohol dehydrogenase family protein n=1 Tax=Oxynema sp. CENA135 TaxID=984206 RepID=UPI00190A0068|nr:iron-containing alcohol dehydrogenase family protein [Oxynema sp. CENA135]MBK4732521.1 iron-containing alcohol dehydrogenase family protein [Oxynema sp. CENA135]